MSLPVAGAPPALVAARTFAVAFLLLLLRLRLLYPKKGDLMRFNTGNLWHGNLGVPL